MNYEIKNSFIKAKIKSFGAELNSLQKIENDFEYIWQADSQYWARHSPVLFPIVGRLKDDIYFYKDKDTLGHAMGKQFRASLAILDEGFAKGILKELKSRT